MDATKHILQQLEHHHLAPFCNLIHLETLIQKLVSNYEQLKGPLLEKESKRLRGNKFKKIKRIKERLHEQVKLYQETGAFRKSSQMPFLAELYAAYDAVKDNPYIPPENIELLHQTYEQKFAELANWEANKADNYFVDFPFFDQLAIKYKEQYITEDMTQFVVAALIPLVTANQLNPKEATNEDLPNTSHVSKPFTMVNNSYETPSRIQFDPYEPGFNEEGNVYLMARPKNKRIQDNQTIDFLMNSKYELAGKEQLLGFTDEDSKFYLRLFEFRDESFLMDKSIVFRATDALRLMYPDVKKFSQIHYNALEKRIEKLRNIAFRMKEQVVNQPGTRQLEIKTVFSLITEYTVLSNKDLTKENSIATDIYYKIFIPDAIYKNYYENQLVSVYGQLDMYQGFSWAIIFPLQLERIKAHKKGLLNQEFTYRYYFFQSYYLFKGSKKQNLKDILQSLLELKEAGNIIQNVHMYKDEFYIRFLPMTTNEIKLLQSTLNLLE